MKVLSKIIEDTLKSRGKWSMKRLSALVVMIFILGLGAFIVLSDKVLEREVNQYAIQVFNSLLLFEATLMGISEFGKKIQNKNVEDNE